MLCLANGPEYLVAYYGALKAGACVVPVAPEVPRDGLELLLADCEASVVFLGPKASPAVCEVGSRVPTLRYVVSTHPAEGASASGVPVIEFASLTSHNLGLEDAGAGDGDLAVILYTSGTTAQPKGVMLTHHGMVGTTSAILEDFGFTNQDRVGIAVPFVHTYGDWVQRSFVAAGGMILTFDGRTIPAEMWRRIDDEKCTMFPGVPPSFAVLRDLRSEYDLSSLRCLTVAGAPLTTEMIGAITKALPQARLYNCYGQTEAGPKLSWLKPEDILRKAGSIGKAVSGVELRIVDEEGRDVSRGGTGELIAVGDNFMSGYWKRPEETAKALQSDGLHTGDLARMDDEGFVWLLGRTDDVLKSGAYRVSPMEIESVIQTLSNVEECAVVGVPDPLLGGVLVAAVVPKSGMKVEAHEVFGVCRSKLPPYKVPTRVVRLDRLPRGRGGKLLRVELTANVRQRVVSDRG
jgi:acyl-coenzyme A synthetase/AMP-(fatty) acid ligase